MSISAPWNKARAVGQRRAFEPDQVRAIAEYLASEHRWHELCLFTLGIDTMLRASDLLALRVEDVAVPGKAISETISLRQKKTRHGVYPVLTPATRRAVAKWISESGKSRNDHLFTGHKPINATAISECVYRRLVKSWAEAIGLDITAPIRSAGPNPFICTDATCRSSGSPSCSGTRIPKPR